TFRGWPARRKSRCAPESAFFAPGHPPASTACAHSPSGVRSLVVSHRAPLAILLLGIVLALTPIAHAAPTDPGWISGIYDDNDYDDIVLFIIGAVGAVEAGGVSPVCPFLLCLRVITLGRPPLVSFPLLPLPSPPT